MVRELALRCRESTEFLMTADTFAKNRVLSAIAERLKKDCDLIIQANEQDIFLARECGLSEAMIERLTLSPQRIQALSDSVYQVAALEDPVGSVIGTIRRPNGLHIEQRRVPLGVVGVIYESRPNVTVDIACLCLKSGNACLLRGGKEAIHSNISLTGVLRGALTSCGFPPDCVCLIEDTRRESAQEMMGLTGILDVLIPRGGAGLIRSVVENSRVPVIETGAGNCHLYVDDEADLNMALEIAFNAKCSRPSVCNSIETLLVARSVAPVFLPMLKEKLKNVELRGCPETCAIIEAVPACDEDWYTEFSDYILAVRVTGGMYQATAHINRYGTKHSEAIVTKNYFTANSFTDRVDAACVYINASTRFTDGGEFGFGAEVGISTQKMHARGPMGLIHLTGIKYVISGNGQVR